MTKYKELMRTGLALGLALATTLSVTAFSGPQTLSQNAKEEIKSRLRNLDKGSVTQNLEMAEGLLSGRNKLSRNHRWLLSAKVFNRLSNIGQQAALRLNGLAAKPRLSTPINEQLRGILPQAAPGENIRTNDPNHDIDFHTQSESSIAANGTNVIVSFNDLGVDNTSGYAFSTDGGNTFVHDSVPTPQDGFNLGDGVVAFGPSGEIYYATLSFNANINSIVGVAKSTDKGATFSVPADASTTIVNEEDFQDKEWLAVDTGASSNFKGNIYVTWTTFRGPSSSFDNFINFSRSTNGGVSFEPPIQISPTGDLVQGSRPVVAPNGDVYVTYFDFFDSAIKITKSTDGGKTFPTPKVAANVIAIGSVTGGNTVRTSSFPAIAIDQKGILHITYSGTTTAITQDRSDIFYVRSTDAGNSFSQPIKVNDDNSATTQFLPSVAVTDDGTVGIKWWDRRNDKLNDSLTDIYMATSTNGGSSFGKNFRITNHNWVFGPSEFASSYHGDYDELTAFGNDFFIAWSDERNNDPDVYFAQVASTRKSTDPDFNISTTKTFDSVIAGKSVDFPINATGDNGFSSMVSLSASPNIDGISYNLANSMVDMGQSTKLTVATSAATKPGTYLVTVTATGAGMTRKTNFRVTVFDSKRTAGVPVNITNTRGFTRPGGLKFDAKGIAHAVFEDDTNDVNVFGNEVFYMQSTDGGKTYSKPLKISDDSSNSFGASFAVDAAGNIYVNWTSFDNDFLGVISFVKSTDGGKSFSTPKTISPSDTDANIPNIAVDSKGNVISTYIDFNTFSIFAVRSGNGGTTFGDGIQISADGELITTSPVAAFDSKGAAFVVYGAVPIGSNRSGIFLATASDGQKFVPAKLVSNNQITALTPQIGVDKDDTVYVTFQNRTGTNNSNFNRDIILIKSTDSGASFGAQINISNSPAQSINPFVILDGTGTVTVAWQDATPDNQSDVMVAQGKAGMNFSMPVNLSGNSGLSALVSGSSDGKGNTIISWLDDSAANSEMFTATLAAASDFTLNFNPATVNVTRGQKGQFTANINRIGGFNGNVTINAPDTKALKIKLTPASQSTTGNSVSFSFNIKKKAATGNQQLTFTARDDSGRVRTGVLTLVVQ